MTYAIVRASQSLANQPVVFALLQVLLPWPQHLCDTSGSAILGAEGLLDILMDAR